MLLLLRNCILIPINHHLSIPPPRFSVLLFVTSLSPAIYFLYIYEQVYLCLAFHIQPISLDETVSILFNLLYRTE